MLVPIPIARILIMLHTEKKQSVLCFTRNTLHHTDTLNPCNLFTKDKIIFYEVTRPFFLSTRSGNPELVVFGQDRDRTDGSISWMEPGDIMMVRAEDKMEDILFMPWSLGAFLALKRME